MEWLRNPGFVQTQSLRKAQLFSTYSSFRQAATVLRLQQINCFVRVKKVCSNWTWSMASFQTVSPFVLSRVARPAAASTTARSRSGGFLLIRRVFWEEVAKGQWCTGEHARPQFFAINKRHLCFCHESWLVC